MDRRYIRTSSGGDTVQLRRPPPKVFTDEFGKTVWMSELVPSELELLRESAICNDPYNHDGRSD